MTDFYFGIHSAYSEAELQAACGAIGGVTLEEYHTGARPLANYGAESGTALFGISPKLAAQLDADGFLVFRGVSVVIDIQLG
jgi:hypothetical protein